MKEIHKGAKGVDDVVVKKVKKEWRFWQRFVGKNGDHLLFAAFVIVLVGIIVVNGIYIINRDKPTGTLYVNSSTNEPSHILNSLQSAHTNAYNVSIANATENSKADPAFRISDTQTMLILDITIRNNSKGQQDFVPVNQLFVKTEDGYLASMHPSMYLTKPIEAKTLAPGETVSGQVSFAVPKSAKSPLLYVDPGWDKQVPVVYDVLK